MLSAFSESDIKAVLDDDSLLQRVEEGSAAEEALALEQGVGLVEEQATLDSAPLVADLVAVPRVDSDSSSKPTLEMYSDPAPTPRSTRTRHRSTRSAKLTSRQLVINATRSTGGSQYAFCKL